MNWNDFRCALCVSQRRSDRNFSLLSLSNSAGIISSFEFFDGFAVSREGMGRSRGEAHGDADPERTGGKRREGIPREGKEQQLLFGEKEKMKNKVKRNAARIASARPAIIVISRALFLFMSDTDTHMRSRRACVLRQAHRLAGKRSGRGSEVY